MKSTRRWPWSARVILMHDDDLDERLERLLAEVAKVQLATHRINRRITKLWNTVDADFAHLYELITHQPHRAARSATLVSTFLTTIERLAMSEIAPTGELLTVVALGADGQPTTENIDNPAFSLDDPSGVFTFTPAADNLSATLTPNPDVFGIAIVGWNATDINGNALLDPATGLAPAYEATVTAPPNPAVSATFTATPI